jgi:hypothetical protein
MSSEKRVLFHPTKLSYPIFLENDKVGFAYAMERYYSRRFNH